MGLADGYGSNTHETQSGGNRYLTQIFILGIDKNNWEVSVGANLTP